MGNQAISIWHRIAAFILGLLGFSSCNIRIGDNRVEYGPPVVHSFLNIHGKVTDENSAPINGIRVIVEYKPENYRDSFRDTLYTSQTGEYDMRQVYGNCILHENSIVCHYDDVDGEDNNGVYESAQTIPTLTEIENNLEDNVFAAEETIVLKKKQ